MGFITTSNRTELIGLDIGSATVKAAKIKYKAGCYQVRALALAQMPVPHTDPSQQQSDRIQCVKRCLADLHSQHRDVVCAVGRDDVLVRSFAFPPLPNNEIPGAVQLEAIQFCPLTTDKNTVDYQLIKARATDHLDDLDDRERKKALQQVTGVLAVAANKVIQQRQDLITQAGARCVLMDVEGLALLNAIEKLNTDGEKRTIAALHVGQSHSTLAIMPPTGFPFIRAISEGGSNIVQSIAKQTGLDQREVSSLLANGSDDSRPPAVRDAFTPACKQLAEAVHETLRYYETQQSAYPVKRLEFCGGFAEIPGLGKRLHYYLNQYPFKVWDPFAFMESQRLNGQSELLHHGPSFAVAIGLAMRTV